MNKARFARLPKEVQTIITEVAKEFEAMTGSVNEENYPKQLEQLRGLGVTVKKVPESVRVDWANSLKDWPQTMAADLDAKGMPASQVLKLTLEGAAADATGLAFDMGRDVLLVLGEAVGVLAGVAQRGAIDLPRAAAAHVADDKLQGASDRGVGAVALAQRVDARVHADRPGDRAVDDHQRPGEMRGAEQAVHGEQRIERRLEHVTQDRGAALQAQALAREARHVDDLQQSVDDLALELVVLDRPVGLPPEVERA